MTAQSPSTMHLASLWGVGERIGVEVGAAFGIQPLPPDFAFRIYALRFESRAVPKPATTLLRQHCALTI